jgi:hypothetical protein
VAGDGLRRGSGESASLPTEVKEVLTLLVNAWRPIANAVGGSPRGEMPSASLALNAVYKADFPSLFELTNRVGPGHVCPWAPAPPVDAGLTGLINSDRET